MDGGEGHSWIFSFWGLHGPEQRRDTGLDSTESLSVADRMVQGTIHRNLIEAFTGNALKPYCPALHKIYHIALRYLLPGDWLPRNDVAPASPIAGPNFPAK